MRNEGAVCESRVEEGLCQPQQPTGIWAPLPTPAKPLHNKENKTKVLEAPEVPKGKEKGTEGGKSRALLGTSGPPERGERTFLLTMLFSQ